MSFELNYYKSKKIDLVHLEKQYEEQMQKEMITNNTYSSQYNPFKIQRLQNYNPIYSLFFEMTIQNYNSISLNHPNHFIDLDTFYDEVTQKKEINKKVHIKYAPLLDPIHYLIGKYEKERNMLHNLPNIEEIHDENKNILNKIKSPYNSAYIDCFFCYLSSKLYQIHNYLNGIDFYGSYLGIQDKFRMEITDDYEYLQESSFFVSNKKKLYELETTGFPPEFLKQSTNPKLILGELCDLEADVELDTNEFDLNIENEINKVELELVYENEQVNVEVDNDSTDSSNNSNENESSIEEDIEFKTEDEYEDEHEASEWSDMEDSVEPSIFAFIHQFPIQMICLEKCEGTFDSLLENEELEEEHIISALFQVIMTLAVYQKAFQFTHNDLHTNNIVYITTNIEYLEYHYLQKIYKVPTYGKIYKIIDFGRSIYRFQDQILCSDSFALGGDAHSQYNIEPFLNKNKPRLEPNPSFDLCRLGCSLYDFVFENEDEEVIYANKLNWTKIQKIVYEWCTDDNGKNILYKRSGEERYPNFKLYKMIARIVHKHTPENQVNKSIFASYLQSSKKMKSKKQNGSVIDIDSIPKYYSYHLKN
jgi:hypothetical protein